MRRTPSTGVQVDQGDSDHGTAPALPSGQRTVSWPTVMNCLRNVSSADCIILPARRWPILAARLQGIAEPNSVVIAESTRKLLGNLFEHEDLGAQDLKGMSGPLRAWMALRPASVESRFEALHGSGLTELVGREEELDLLLRRWPKAKTGEGQVVLLSGEAGIGKSRLTAALLERLVTEPHTRLRYFCSPQHTDSALYPIIGQMERAARLTHSDTAQVKLDQLDALLAQTSTSIQDASLFADMLSLPNDGRYPTLDPDPAATTAKNTGSTQPTGGCPVALQSGADDSRGCALVRPHALGGLRSGGGADCQPSRAVDRDLQARV